MRPLGLGPRIGLCTLLTLVAAAPAAAAPPTFTGPTPFPAHSFPIAVAAADLNGDGRPDLVTANSDSNGDNGNTVLLNTTLAGAATPNFSGPTAFDAFLAPQSVVAADLTGDGRPELITANRGSDGGTSVLVNTTVAGAPTPSFDGPTSFPSGTDPASAAAADLNGDGKPDLITANAVDDNVTVLINTTASGTLSFDGPTSFGVGNRPWSVIAADLNGDGRPDLATASSSSDGADGVSVLLNTTAPGAPAPSFATTVHLDSGPFPLSVEAADLNSDGKPDLITANNAANGANGNSVLVNATPGGATTPSFAGPIPFPADNGPYDVTATDANSDGKPDLVTANWNVTGLGGNTLLINTTEPGEELPTFAGPTPLITGETPVSVASADFNGDGRPDLATANQETDSPGFLDGNTVLINTTPFPFAAGPSSLAFGSQPRTTISSPRSVTLDNSTDATLPVEITLSGNTDEMLISRNTCTDGIPANGSCSVGVRFAPSESGPRSATLALDPDGPQSMQVALTGTGGALPQGSAGPAGPTGRTGPQGPTGRPGRDARVTCRVAKPRRGSRRTRVTCRVRLVATSARVPWRLTRGGRTRASGVFRAGDGRATLRLRRLASGRYALRIAGRRVATIRVGGSQRRR
jgi:FG-GAP-like repeat/FG-GAP repeat